MLPFDGGDHDTHVAFAFAGDCPVWVAVDDAVEREHGVVDVCFLVDDGFLAAVDDKVPALVVGAFELPAFAAFGPDHERDAPQVDGGEHGAGAVAAVHVDVGVEGDAVGEVAESAGVWVDGV